jgi:outer membrane protein OmpA-like peptidoglycan-associated protein
MSFNILDAVKGHLTPDLISKATSFLGENESGVAKAMSGIIPAVLSGMITKAASGNEGAAEIFNVAKETHNSGFLGNMSNFFNQGGGMLDKGLGLVQKLFGDKTNSIITSISSFAGIKNSSVGSLLSMAAPLAAGTLGKHAESNNLDASGLASMLSSQKNSIMNMLPGGLGNIAGMLGLGKVGESLSAITGGAKETFNNSTEFIKKSGNSMGWLKWLLPLLIAAALVWWFLLGGKNGCNNTPAPNTDTTTVQTSAADTAAGNMPVADESFKVKLPDGTELNAMKGGIEEKVVVFLGTNWQSLGTDSLKKIWFDFDNLNFKTGSATLTEESQQQVNNMVAILKAFPAAKIKIGGYTDKTGNEASNKKLSAERANTIKTALEKAGVGAQVTGAEGYGSEFAKYPADAPESDRVKDRHVSVSIRE